MSDVNERLEDALRRMSPYWYPNESVEARHGRFKAARDDIRALVRELGQHADAWFAQKKRLMEALGMHTSGLVPTVTKEVDIERRIRELEQKRDSAQADAALARTVLDEHLVRGGCKLDTQAKRELFTEEQVREAQRRTIEAVLGPAQELSPTVDLDAIIAEMKGKRDRAKQC